MKINNIFFKLWAILIYNQNFITFTISNRPVATIKFILLIIIINYESFKLNV